MGYAAPSLGLNPLTSDWFCGQETQSININIADVKDLWGYQFEVAYNASKVSASGEFVNSFFDTTANANIPGGWSASCSAGVCKFAATRTRADGVLSLNGSGILAKITFTGIAPTDSTLITIQNDKLSDLDGMPIVHSLTANPATLKVCGLATVSGTVKLQGRATPMTSGTVTLTDGAFGPYPTSFSALDGAFSQVVKVLPAGSSYTAKAEHVMYMGNLTTAMTLLPGETKVLPATTLKGGDVTGDGNVTIGDLSAIGGMFDTQLPTGPDTAPDVTGDTWVNIFDLAIAGGNYEIHTPPLLAW